MSFLKIAKIAAPILGSAIMGSASAKAQEKANEENIQLSRDQMAFQERMSNTSHQREVADLRAAGLNPILSGTGGMGASSPQGQTAKVESVETTGIATALEALTKITQAFLTREQTEKTKAETDAVKELPAKTRADVKNVEQQTSTARTQQTKMEYETVNIAQDTKVKENVERLLKFQAVSEDTRNKILYADLDVAAAAAAAALADKDITQSTYGEIMRYIKYTSSAFGGSLPNVNVRPTSVYKSNTTIQK